MVTSSSNIKRGKPSKDRISTMKLLKTCGSLTALSLVVLYNAINTPFSHAAQLGLGDSIEADSKLNTETAQSDVCEEEPIISPEALQESSGPLSQSSGPNLLANATTSDVSTGLLSAQTLIAENGLIDCGIGGVAPEGGLPAAAGFPLAAALIPAGAAAAAIPFVVGGDDDPADPAPPVIDPPDPAPPSVPEPAEAATAGLFACLGVVGVLAKRKMNRSR